MLIDHIKVEEECLTYKVALTAGYLFNDPHRFSIVFILSFSLLKQ